MFFSNSDNQIDSPFKEPIIADVSVGLTPSLFRDVGRVSQHTEHFAGKRRHDSAGTDHARFDHVQHECYRLVVDHLASYECYVVYQVLVPLDDRVLVVSHAFDQQNTKHVVALLQKSRGLFGYQVEVLAEANDSDVKQIDALRQILVGIDRTQIDLQHRYIFCSTYFRSFSFMQLFSPYVPLLLDFYENIQYQIIVSH